MIISHTTTTATNDYVEHCNDMDFKWKGGIDGWMDGLTVMIWGKVVG